MEFSLSQQQVAKREAFAVPIWPCAKHRHNWEGQELAIQGSDLPQLSLAVQSVLAIHAEERTISKANHSYFLATFRKTHIFA